MPGNLKEKIRRGDIVVGCSLIASPGNFGRTPADRGRIEQLLNSYPYDFFTVDSQHMPYNEEALFRLCDIAREFEVPVQLRIKSPKWTYMIGGILDLCLGGVEVPQCDDEATAQDAVENFYYPQKGKRGWGGVAYDTGWSGGDGEPHSIPTRTEYAEWWSQTGVLMLQVESVEAVINARNLAKPGVDCLSWGAHPTSNDLAFSREGHPEFPLKTDQECLEHMIDLLKGSDTKVCMRSGARSNREHYQNLGVTVFMERAEV